MKLKLVLPIVSLLLLGIICWQYYVIHQAQSTTLQAGSKQDELWVDKTDPKPAPNVKLTDQNGKAVSLSDFKGKAIVLQFLDPVCTDICPLISKEVFDANKVLGDKSKQVEFVAINVNPNHTKTDEMKEYSSKNGLIDLPNWHFLTGNPDVLKKAWKDYNITVVPSKDPNGEMIHSPTIFFIDAQGIEQFIANPDSDNTHISEWGKTLADYALKTAK